MSELSNVVFYLLSTVAQVYATILGFFIVGQIYIYGVIHKVREKNEEIQRLTGSKGCTNLVVTKSVKNIYKLLLAVILISILGILFNIESIFGKGILIIPAIVLVLAIWIIITLYNYITTLERY